VASSPRATGGRCSVLPTISSDGGWRASGRPGRPPVRAAAAFDDVAEELYEVLEVPVRIRAGKRGGSLELRFRDRDELERLVALLRSLK